MKVLLRLGFMAVLVAGITSAFVIHASDHDDGENDKKSKALNLTDLYVFREQDQDSSAVPGNLIFIMNVNPRSVARQQFYYSTNAVYDFHVTRRINNTDPVTGLDDVLLRFQFGEPNGANQQAITITAYLDGQTLSASSVTGGGPILTTPIGQPQPAPVNNAVTLGSAALTVFSGLREDPFFFDVEQFFRVRAGALGTGPSVLFRPTTTAVDFTAGYNVLGLVVRLPINFLKGPSTATVFDVWETVSIPE